MRTLVNENTLKLNLLSFLEKNGAYNASGQAVLPGGPWADLTDFLPQSGAQQEQLEELLQKMRESWQLAAFWLNGKWMAFYTPLGHQELNRLRGSHSLPPSQAFDAQVFWLSLENHLKEQGLLGQARQISQLRTVPAIMEASRQVLSQLGLR